MTETTSANQPGGLDTPATVVKRRSRWRRVRIVVLALVLIVLLVRTGVDLWAGYRVRAVMAHLELRHGSLDPRTLMVPPVPPEQNRARPMRAAATFMAGQHQVAATFVAQRGPMAVPAELRAFVEANREALRLADEARTRPLSNWEAEYATGSKLPSLMEIRTLSNALYLAARLELDAANADGAARHFATGLSLASSLKQEPSIIAQLIRAAMSLQQFEGVQRLVAHSEPSTAALEEVARWLDDNRAPEPMQIGLLGELKFVGAALTQMEYGRGTGLWAGIAGDGPTTFWGAGAISFGRPMIRLALAGSLERMGELLEIQAGPRPRPVAPRPPASWSPLKKLEDKPIAGLERAMETSDHFSSARGLAELAVALRRFRIDRGQYPDTLAALVPAYVPGVPIDPFTGKPPVYGREGAGFRLRAENGGKFVGVNAAVLDWTVPK